MSLLLPGSSHTSETSSLPKPGPPPLPSPPHPTCCQPDLSLAHLTRPACCQFNALHLTPFNIKSFFDGSIKAIYTGYRHGDNASYLNVFRLCMIRHTKLQVREGGRASALRLLNDAYRRARLRYRVFACAYGCTLTHPGDQTQAWWRRGQRNPSSLNPTLPGPSSPNPEVPEPTSRSPCVVYPLRSWAARRCCSCLQ